MKQRKRGGNRNRYRRRDMLSAAAGLTPDAPSNMEGQVCEQEPGRCENLSEEGPRRIVMGDYPMNAAKGVAVVEERGGGNEGAHHCESHPFRVCSVQHIG